jgi:hypothetical protein
LTNGPAHPPDEPEAFACARCGDDTQRNQLWI